MIQDLDSSIADLLMPLTERGVEISFETPDDQFGPTSPAVNLFLYDVRENRDLRGNDWNSEAMGHKTGSRRFPPVRVDCSYLVTAWARPGEGAIKTEHEVLGEVMTLLLKYPRLPRDKLRGCLKEQELPLPAATLQPGRLQSLGEFWQALGGKPKAAFDYTVTVAVPSEIIEPDRPVGYVRERELTVGDKDWLETAGCDLRMDVESDGKTEAQMIREFKLEFASKRQRCAVLIIRSETDSDTWTTAGFGDAGDFRVVVIDDPKHELAHELNKKQLDKARIVELATSSLGRTLSKSKGAQRGDWKKPDERIADTRVDVFADKETTPTTKRTRRGKGRR